MISHLNSENENELQTLRNSNEQLPINNNLNNKRKRLPLQDTLNIRENLRTSSPTQKQTIATTVEDENQFVQSQKKPATSSNVSSPFKRRKNADDEQANEISIKSIKNHFPRFEPIQKEIVDLWKVVDRERFVFLKINFHFYFIIFIFKTLNKTKTKTKINNHSSREYVPTQYWNFQPHLKFSFRAKLFDWLLEIAEELLLCRETIQSTFNLIDRFLSLVPSVESSNFQLVGIAAFSICTKSFERTHMTLSELVKLCESKYDKKQIKQMERVMCDVLDWRFLPTTPICYLSIFSYRRNQSTQSSTNDVAMMKACDLIDLSSLDPESLSYLPSELATAVFLLEICRVSEIGVVENNENDYDEILDECLKWTCFEKVSNSLGKCFEFVKSRKQQFQSKYKTNLPLEFQSLPDFWSIQRRPTDSNPEFLKHIEKQEKDGLKWNGFEFEIVNVPKKED